jgi:hypothetical protein
MEPLFLKTYKYNLTQFTVRLERSHSIEETICKFDTSLNTSRKSTAHLDLSATELVVKGQKALFIWDSC